MNNYYCIIFALILAACGAPSAATRMANSIPVSPTPSEEHPSGQAIPPNSATPSLVPTPLPSVDSSVSDAQASSIGWLTYTSSDGVTVQYPTEWVVEEFDNRSIAFISPTIDEHLDNHEQRVMLNIYPRPPADRAIADPHTWPPNEGGYKIQWEQPLAVEYANGLLFVNAPDSSFTGDERAPSLSAIYYSEPHELDVRLETSLNQEAVAAVKEEWFDAAFAQHHPIFLHMVESVRFPPPAVTSPLSTPTPMVSTPRPCTTDLPPDVFRTDLSGEWLLCRGVLGNRYTLLYLWEFTVDVVEGPSGPEWRFVDREPPPGAEPFSLTVRTFATDLPLHEAEQMVYPDGTPVIEPGGEQFKGQGYGGWSTPGKIDFVHSMLIEGHIVIRHFFRFPEVDPSETLVIFSSITTPMTVTSGPNLDHTYQNSGREWVINYIEQNIYSSIEPLSSYQ